MSSSCIQPGLAGSTSLFEPADRCLDRAPSRPVRLTAETVLVTAGVFAAARIVYAKPVAGYEWLLIPALLVAAALIPTWVARRDFPRLGLDRDHVRQTFRILGLVCISTLPLVFLGLWIASHLHLPIPLRPSIAGRSGWLAWLLYQFLYVAVAEEVFFRGYVQTNVARLLALRQWRSPIVQQSVALFVSAACFALAHALVQGRLMSLLTFLPGLLLAWLFCRTRTLLAPILFHGLANVAYGIMTLALV